MVNTEQPSEANNLDYHQLIAAQARLSGLAASTTITVMNDMLDTAFEVKKPKLILTDWQREGMFI